MTSDEMTRISEIKTAVDEALRFVDAAEEFLTRVENNDGIPIPSKEHAAMRRASMDLTRALPVLRRGIHSWLGRN